MKNDTGIVNTPAKILLVEDNQADVDLAKEALKEAKVTVSLDVVDNGEDAIHYLRKENQYAKATKPDLILLDLNLPRIDGREVLEEIKSDSTLKCIPVVILTTSDSDKDMLSTYNNHANCYIKKTCRF